MGSHMSWCHSTCDDERMGSIRHIGVGVTLGHLLLSKEGCQNTNPQSTPRLSALPVIRWLGCCSGNCGWPTAMCQGHDGKTHCGNNRCGCRTQWEGALGRCPVWTVTPNTNTCAIEDGVPRVARSIDDEWQPPGGQPRRSHCSSPSPILVSAARRTLRGEQLNMHSVQPEGWRH